MKVLLDTTVVLDVLLDREPFALSAARLLAKAEKGELTGIVCATTVTTVFRLATKGIGREGARDLVRALLGIVDVAAVNRGTLEGALEMKGADFEDNVIAESARLSGVRVIVTRDQDGFRHASCRVMTPEQLLAAIDEGN